LVVITGARQTGKTTLARHVYSQLRHVSLDAPENRDALRELSTAAWAETVGEAVIDEAQKEPSVFDKVKYSFDDGKISFTVLTGSSQILLLQKIRESLAGRAFSYEMWPLMQCVLRVSAVKRRFSVRSDSARSGACKRAGACSGGTQKKKKPSSLGFFSLLGTAVLLSAPSIFSVCSVRDISCLCGSVANPKCSSRAPR